MWAAQIDRVLSGSPSELERRALADGSVSDAELHEGFAQFAACMEALPYGFSVNVHADGAMDIGPLDDYFASYGSEESARSAYEDLVADCEAGTIAELAPLHSGMRSNPRGLTAAQEIRECFVRHDVPDGAELSEDAFEQLITSPGYEPSTPWAVSCLRDALSEVLLTEDGPPPALSTQ